MSTYGKLTVCVPDYVLAGKKPTQVMSIHTFTKTYHSFTKLALITAPTIRIVNTGITVVPKLYLF